MKAILILALSIVSLLLIGSLLLFSKNSSEDTVYLAGQWVCKELIVHKEKYIELTKCVPVMRTAQGEISLINPNNILKIKG